VTRWVRWGVAALVATACTKTAADHEALGDKAYAAHAYRDALAEYELWVKVHPSADVHAKTAAAALHAEDYGLAVEEYRALAEKDRGRASEAAEGLDRVVRAALAANDRAALGSALTALRAVAPGRPLGPYAKLAALDAVDRGDTAAALALLPAAVASASDGRNADSLLFLYGLVAARANDCTTGESVFEGVLRRQRDPGAGERAREGLSLCALLTGQGLLAQGKPADAEPWFKRAAAPGGATDVARAAYLGLGDVALARGDVGGALESYQQALVGGSPGDSLTARAQDKINALGKADAPAPPAP
jgi:tetratricopeptide (TPR) repeat protein